MGLSRCAPQTAHPWYQHPFTACHHTHPRVRAAASVRSRLPCSLRLYATTDGLVITAPPAADSGKQSPANRTEGSPLQHRSCSSTLANVQHLVLALVGLGMLPLLTAWGSAQWSALGAHVIMLEGAALLGSSECSTSVSGTSSSSSGSGSGSRHLTRPGPQLGHLQILSFLALLLPAAWAAASYAMGAWPAGSRGAAAAALSKGLSNSITVRSMVCACTLLYLLTYAVPGWGNVLKTQHCQVQRLQHTQPTHLLTSSGSHSAVNAQGSRRARRLLTGLLVALRMALVAGWLLGSLGHAAADSLGVRSVPREQQLLKLTWTIIGPIAAFVACLLQLVGVSAAMQ